MIELVVLNSTYQKMGAFAGFDYAGEHSTFNDRLTRCYELAALAFFDWSGKDDLIAEYDLPTPETLVHGMWQGPEPVAIGHAWVVLSDGNIWEPISGLLYRTEEFYAYTKGQVIETYSETATKINMLSFDHYGPWHES